MYVSPTSMLHVFVLNTTRNIKNSYPVSYIKRDVESTKEDNEWNNTSLLAFALTVSWVYCLLSNRQYVAPLTSTDSIEEEREQSVGGE